MKEAAIRTSLFMSVLLFANVIARLCVCFSMLLFASLCVLRACVCLLAYPSLPVHSSSIPPSVCVFAPVVLSVLPCLRAFFSL